MFRHHRPKRDVYRVGPPCPACQHPTSVHCLIPGCRLFECLPCGIWGGADHVWHLRYKQVTEP